MRPEDVTEEDLPDRDEQIEHMEGVKKAIETDHERVSGLLKRLRDEDEDHLEIVRDDLRNGDYALEQYI